MIVQKQATGLDRVPISYEKMPVTICPDSTEASVMVAKQIAAIIRDRRSSGQLAILGLATGSTPKKVYAELVRLHRSEGLSFSNVVVFNLDEYVGIPGDSPESYRSYMKKHLFDHIDVSPENCHIPDGSLRQDLKRHCENYERKIEEMGGIDFQLLGIGRNGHIGFNEPGSSISSSTRLVTLDSSTRRGAAAEFGCLANVPKRAITMGVNTIMNAKRIVILGWGEEKAEIVRQALEGPTTEQVPASYLQAHRNVEFVMDESCASLLTRLRAPWLVTNVTWNAAMIKKAVIQLALQINKPIMKLTNADYNENGLSELLAHYNNAYDINIEVFNSLQGTITGWPGGKAGTIDLRRPERAWPVKKRVLIFSPHPDDDIISMGGTFQRLVDHGHEVHVAYQTSGNIAVADDEALRFIEFARDFNEQFKIDCDKTAAIHNDALDFLDAKESGAKDTDAIRMVKGLIRKGEAYSTCRFIGIPTRHIHYLRMPFYETGLVEKRPLSEADYGLIIRLIEIIEPHQIYAADDLADPHGTHKVCLDAVLEALRRRLKNGKAVENCWVWLYKGAWAEWDIDKIEMAVPMSPDQVLKKRHGIFKHQSQKDGVVFQGSDTREFWQRAEERNRRTAEIYNKLGLAEYEAMEAFVRWRP
jgi:glucosamine-6-phosphate deaminase